MPSGDGGPTPRQLSRRRFPAGQRKRTLRQDVEGYTRIQAYVFLGVFFGVFPLVALAHAVFHVF
jgi:hypothetical protein